MLFMTLVNAVSTFATSRGSRLLMFHGANRVGLFCTDRISDVIYSCVSTSDVICSILISRIFCTGSAALCIPVRRVSDIACNPHGIVRCGGSTLTVSIARLR